MFDVTRWVSVASWFRSKDILQSNGILVEGNTFLLLFYSFYLIFFVLGHREVLLKKNLIDYCDTAFFLRRAAFGPFAIMAAAAWQFNQLHSTLRQLLKSFLFSHAVCTGWKQTKQNCLYVCYFLLYRNNDKSRTLLTFCSLMIISV